MNIYKITSTALSCNLFLIVNNDYLLICAINFENVFQKISFFGQTCDELISSTVIADQTHVIIDTKNISVLEYTSMTIGERILVLFIVSELFLCVLLIYYVFKLDNAIMNGDYVYVI